MMWGAFSSHGKYDLAIVPTRIDSGTDHHIIGNYLKPHLNMSNDNQWIFQQDNASVKVSKKTKDYLESMQINTMTWSAVSSDLIIALRTSGAFYFEKYMKMGNIIRPYSICK